MAGSRGRSARSSSGRAPGPPRTSAKGLPGGWIAGSIGRSGTSRWRSDSTSRFGFHTERMQPGHDNFMLDSARVGPLPRRAVVEHWMKRWFFSPRRHVRRTLLETLASECSALVISNVQPQSVSSFLTAARRLSLPVVAYVSSWDHTVGKGVISPALCPVHRPERHDGGRSPALPRHRSEPRGRHRLAADRRLPPPPTARRLRCPPPRVRSSIPLDRSSSSWATRRRTRLTKVASSSGSLTWWEEVARDRFQLLFRAHPRDREWRERFGTHWDGRASTCRSRASPTSSS